VGVERFDRFKRLQQLEPLNLDLLNDPIVLRLIPSQYFFMRSVPGFDQQRGEQRAEYKQATNSHNVATEL
jgi:hypothetical protein